MRKIISKGKTTDLKDYEMYKPDSKYSKYYPEDEKTKDARVFLTYSVGIVLKIGMKLLGIEMPDKM